MICPINLLTPSKYVPFSWTSSPTGLQRRAYSIVFARIRLHFDRQTAWSSLCPCGLRRSWSLLRALPKSNWRFCIMKSIFLLDVHGLRWSDRYMRWARLRSISLEEHGKPICCLFVNSVEVAGLSNVKIKPRRLIGSEASSICGFNCISRRRNIFTIQLATSSS